MPLDVTAGLVEAMVERFHRSMLPVYGYRLAEAVVELVHLNATAVGTVPTTTLSSTQARPSPSASGRCRSSPAAGSRRPSTGGPLGAGPRSRGPRAWIEEMMTVVHPAGGMRPRLGRCRASIASSPTTNTRRLRRSSPVHDPVWLKILHAQLVNICEEMSFAMMRTSYSPIFSEGLDFCCLILSTETVSSWRCRTSIRR